MMCESCGEYEANVHVTHVINGVARELHVCEECATKSGINVQSPLSLTDILMGLGALEEAEEAGPEKTCPFCKLGIGEFKKSSMLGCPVCYEAFGNELKTLLGGMQKGSKHAGKMPASYAVRKEKNTAIAALQKELDSAVASEDYEKAARVRDQIRGARAAAAAPEKK